jgi:hypothetical protein
MSLTDLMLRSNALGEVGALCVAEMLKVIGTVD